MFRLGLKASGRHKSLRLEDCKDSSASNPIIRPLAIEEAAEAGSCREQPFKVQMSFTSNHQDQLLL